MPTKPTTLADNTFDDMVNKAVKHIVEEVLGGKTSLRNACYWIVDVSARWGKETWEHRKKKNQ